MNAPVLSSNVILPAARYETGMLAVIVKSGVTPNWAPKPGLAIRTREPTDPFGTLLAMSMMTTGLAPVASHARMRPALTRFWPEARMRSWIAWKPVFPFTPPMTCSICIRWKVAKAGEATANDAALIRSMRQDLFNLMDGPPGKRERL